jgi:hypothetical protein
VVLWVLTSSLHPEYGSDNFLRNHLQADPEGHSQHLYRRENLKSQTVDKMFTNPQGHNLKCSNSVAIYVDSVASVSRYHNFLLCYTVIVNKRSVVLLKMICKYPEEVTKTGLSKHCPIYARLYDFTCLVHIVYFLITLYV